LDAWKDDDKTKENVVKFAFLLKQNLIDEIPHYDVTYFNQGIPHGNVILAVESWLDKAKQQFKQNINS